MPILQQPAQPPPQTAPTATAGPSGRVDLEKLAKETEAKIPDQYQQEFQALMLSGEKIMWSPQTHPMMLAALKPIQRPEDIPAVVSQAIVKLMKLILQQSKQKKAMVTMPRAALVLTYHALRFVETQMKMPVTAPIVNATIRRVTQGTLAIYKIAPQQVQQVIAAGHQKMQGQQGQGQPAGVPATQAAAPQAPAPKRSLDQIFGRQEAPNA